MAAEIMPTTSFPFPSPPQPALCSCWKAGWMVQTWMQQLGSQM